ncbi:auxin-induced protein 5ng4-like [Trifolium pratense]|uniref:WAT1-related protein n=1 Tax=Trifolium pratense TaxID=57577 RepID=A0A2K3NB86_TRIPR|nr:auxin-induced protein 5ng4-like [Trifolium pratense]
MKEGFYLFGLDNTSPTFASAMQNSVPALTFLMAVYESLHLNRINGIAKVFGVLASVGGASIITLYKGPTIYAPNLELHQRQFLLSLFEDANGKNLNLGGILLFGHCLCWSGWIVMQAFVLKKYSAQLTVSAFTCFFGVVQFGTIAAFLEKDPKSWKLNSIEEAYSILYSGLVISGMTAAIQIWTINKGGPVLASIYLPLQTILVALMAPIVFGEEFFLGGIIGAFLIISGLYLVVWGRSQETKFVEEFIISTEPENHLKEKSDGSSLIEPLIPVHNS